jgi:hypothetical protein
MSDVALALALLGLLVGGLEAVLWIAVTLWECT